MTPDPTLKEILQSCRAMRRLKPDPIPEVLLMELLQAGHQAATGSNAQDRHWVVVRDLAIKLELAALNKQTTLGYVAASRAVIDRVAAGSRGSMSDVGAMSGWIGHQEVEKRRRMMDAIEWQANHLHEIPVLIVVCLEFEAAHPDTFAAGAAAGGEVWPGIQNLLLTARSLGLGAVPTTLPLVDKSSVRKVLGLPETVEPLCLIPVGYPMGKFGPVSRRPLSEVVHYDGWA